MKIKPEILLNSPKDISYKKIFVTGSDEAFISFMKDNIIEDFKKRNFFIDFSGNHNSGIIGNLFSDKKTLFILGDLPTKKSEDYDKDDSEHFLIICSNGKKANNIKVKLAKLKEVLILECYELARKSKESVLENFIEKNKMNVSSDVFWYIIDSFSNNYVIFINQLKTLSLFNKKIELIKDVEQAIFVENKMELNKIFFNIFKSNNYLTRIFEKNILSISDFYIFLNSIKLYLDIINKSAGKENALLKFPKYLFAEKNNFVEIYKKINKEKSLKIYRNISKVEILARKHPGLYSVLGFRFFLSLKKIIIS